MLPRFLSKCILGYCESLNLTKNINKSTVRSLLKHPFTKYVFHFLFHERVFLKSKKFLFVLETKRIFRKNISRGILQDTLS